MDRLLLVGRVLWHCSRYPPKSRTMLFPLAQRIRMACIGGVWVSALFFSVSRALLLLP